MPPVARILRRSPEYSSTALQSSDSRPTGHRFPLDVNNQLVRQARQCPGHGQVLHHTAAPATRAGGGGGSGSGSPEQRATHGAAAGGAGGRVRVHRVASRPKLRRPKLKRASTSTVFSTNVTRGVSATRAIACVSSLGAENTRSTRHRPGGRRRFVT